MTLAIVMTVMAPGTHHQRERAGCNCGAGRLAERGSCTFDPAAREFRHGHPSASQGGSGVPASGVGRPHPVHVTSAWNRPRDRCRRPGRHRDSRLPGHEPRGARISTATSGGPGPTGSTPGPEATPDQGHARTAGRRPRAQHCVRCCRAGPRQPPGRCRPRSSGSKTGGGVPRHSDDSRGRCDRWPAAAIAVAACAVAPTVLRVEVVRHSEAEGGDQDPPRGSPMPAEPACSLNSRVPAGSCASTPSTSALPRVQLEKPPSSGQPH